MNRVELLEGQVRELSEAELAAFRRWFEEFDMQTWDQQIEDDARAGKLDSFAEAALADHAGGRTTPL
ncbi:MAG: hypothetical protein ACKVVP_03075 [Chloroflexota bacterium]